MDPGVACCNWASMWTVGLHELIMRSLHCTGAHMVCARRRLDFLAHMRNGKNSCLHQSARMYSPYVQRHTPANKVRAAPITSIEQHALKLDASGQSANEGALLGVL